MNPKRRVHIVGNWKMNQTLDEIKKFFIDLSKSRSEKNCEAWIAPQFIHISIVKDLAFTTGNVMVGAQNASHEAKGAFTGDISPVSLKDMGVHFVIIGHSERRAFFKESDEILNKKTLLSLSNDLKVIFCVGETLSERDSGQTMEIIKSQLNHGLKDIPKNREDSLLIAYEPVWAIGTGKVATPEQAEEVHAMIRSELKKLGFDSEKRVILYGGSVTPENAEGLLFKPNIDGALVGGASLKGESFVKLLEAVR